MRVFHFLTKSLMRRALLPIAALMVVLTATVAVVGRRALESDAHATGHLLTYLLLCVALLAASRMN